MIIGVWRGGIRQDNGERDLIEWCKTANRRDWFAFTNGCFSVITPSHVSLLHEAFYKFTKKIIVALNTDESIVRLKGERSVIGDGYRACMLSALHMVEFAVVYDQDEPHELLQLLKPSILFKGGTTDEIIGREIVDEYGGKVVKMPVYPGPSSTEILRKNTPVD